VLGTISVETARMMARLYATARLYINFFQPSFKLKEKRCGGAKVIKRYGASNPIGINGCAVTAIRSSSTTVVVPRRFAQHWRQPFSARPARPASCRE
jgi:hypothetical protein